MSGAIPREGVTGELIDDRADLTWDFSTGTALAMDRQPAKPD